MGDAAPATATEPRLATRRVHIAGAPGSGTTTVGQTLAARLAIPYFDADDFFWLPTNPPYRLARPQPDRVRLMRELFLDRDAWVLSGGTVSSWATEIVPSLDLVVFLIVPTAVRLERLKARQQRQFGVASAPGGWNHRQTLEFYDFAAGYDDGPADRGRTRARHEAWLATLACPVLRLDGSRPIAANVAAIAAHLPAL